MGAQLAECSRTLSRREREIAAPVPPQVILYFLAVFQLHGPRVSAAGGAESSQLLFAG